MGTVDRRIKVIEFIESTNDGGAETLVKDYAMFLDKHKFDIKICVLKEDVGTANGRLIRENKIPLIKILPDWYYRTFKFITRHMKHYTEDSYIPTRFRKILEREKPDVLHVHLDLLTYVEKVSDLLHNTKVFYTCHSEPEVHLGGKNAKQDIYCGVHYRDNTEYSMYTYTQGTCPRAHEASEHIITMPLHMWLTDEDVQKIIDAVNEFYK